MTKFESKEVNKMVSLAKLDSNYIDYAARSISAIARSTRTKKNFNEIITIAASIPAIVQSTDFII